VLLLSVGWSSSVKTSLSHGPGKDFLEIDFHVIISSVEVMYWRRQQAKSTGSVQLYVLFVVAVSA
jgi:hypothetical protein